MTPDRFEQGLARVLGKTAAFPGRRLHVDVIVNPASGGFTRPRAARRILDGLAAAERDAETLPERASGVEIAFHRTARPGHATEIAAKLIFESKPTSDEARLLVSAGGDGTSLEIMKAMMAAPNGAGNGFAVLRLPLGTGNDGADGRDVRTSLGRLLAPSEPATQRAVRVTTASGRGPWHAFNIASVGLDAFVTDMTNRMKRFLPGDSYRIFLDLAAVFYDRIYEVRPSRFTLSLDGKETAREERKLLILVMGCSGNRQYGSNKKILPGEENVCFVDQMPLARKIATKNTFAEGTHRSVPEAHLARADRIELYYEGRILVQTDGEAELLGPDDFPLVMELTPPCIRFLPQA